MVSICLKYIKIENKNINNYSYQYDLHNINSLDDILDSIYNIFYDSKQVEFVIAGLGCSNWGMDYKYDLPCVIENVEYILRRVNNKQAFSIDFYEQGRECIFEYSFIKDMVYIKYWFYLQDKEKKEECVPYNYIQEMFKNLFEEFTSYAEQIIPGIKQNKLYVEWKNRCKNA